MLFDILIANFWFTFPLPALMAVTMSIINSSLAKQGRQSKYSAWTEPKSQRYLQLCSLEKSRTERFLGPGESELEIVQRQRLNLNLPECRAPATHESQSLFVRSFMSFTMHTYNYYFFTYCQYIWLYICVQTVSNLTDKEFVWILPPYTSCFTHNHRSEMYTLAEYISFQQEKQTKLGNNK